MRQRRILGDEFWWDHECRVLRVFKLALELLRGEEGLDTCENSLNRKLLLCIRRANYLLDKRNEGIGYPIMIEAKNQPDADDEQRAQREDKSPDFQWGLTDKSEQDPLRQDKFYVVECKRLGKPVRKSWVFNRNYVEHGILRFVSAGHGYGESTPSGAMVGYIRSMSSKDILDEVNGHATGVGLDEIILSDGGWISNGVSRLDQKLDRPEVPPTPFSLRHLWVDLRQK